MRRGLHERILRLPLLPERRTAAEPCQPCPVCGERWEPKKNSRLPCHSDCLVEDWAAIAMFRSRRSQMATARMLGLPIKTVAASVQRGARLLRERERLQHRPRRAPMSPGARGERMRGKVAA